MSQPFFMHGDKLNIDPASRLVDDIRNATGASDKLSLSKVWDVPSEYNVDEQFRADLRAASGIGKATGLRKGKVNDSHPLYWKY